jgi:hypothetical protein
MRTNGHKLFVDFRPDALLSDLVMNAEGKIQCGCAFSQRNEVYIGSKHLDLFIEQVELEVVNEFQGAVFTAFDHLPNLLNPLI